MRILLIIATVFLIGCQPPAVVQAAAAAGGEPIQPPCFEPADDCGQLLVDQIDAAEREILIMAYAFSERRIANALAAAVERGVRVRMIVDRRRDRTGLMTTLPGRGVELLTDPVDVQHNKVMIFDRRRLATGSQNFTRGSRNNAENLLLIDHEATVAAYVRNWLHRAEQSSPFVAPAAD